MERLFVLSGRFGLKFQFAWKILLELEFLFAWRILFELEFLFAWKILLELEKAKLSTFLSLLANTVQDTFFQHLYDILACQAAGIKTNAVFWAKQKLAVPSYMHAA